MKCTGLHCPMQHGYDVEDCMITNCKYRTIPGTNYERIKSMTIEEMAIAIDKLTCICATGDRCEICPIYVSGHSCRPQDIMEWLESEVEENDK